MLSTTRRAGASLQPAAIVLRTAIVVLALVSAAIHLSLGGLMFTLNAVGYAILAAAMVVPGPIGRVRWLVRVALLGFTVATIGGWVLFGARFPLAYLDKAVELVLVAFLVGELWVFDGGPAGVLRQARTLVAGIVRLAVR